MKKNYIITALLACVTCVKAQVNKPFWQPIAESAIEKTGVRDIVPNKFKTYHLDLQALKNMLLQAPNDKQVSAINSSIIVSLPMPDGTIERFKVVEAPVMDEALQASYPNIRTFSVHGIDDVYASGKLDFNEFGFHGMIRSPKGDVFMDPYCKWNTTDYITYYTTDFEKPTDKRTFCEGVIGAENSNQKSVTAPSATICAGANLRTYRLAVGCTGEYAIAATGSATPTTAQVLAKVVTSINRVDGVYETEVAVRLVLVATTTLVLFTTPGTGYTTAENNNASSLISKSQSLITSTIGSANFDIGHTFSTGGGGLANLGCVCNTSTKASGITGSPSPVGDPYDIDYVAHEIGHQFRGNHTFRAGTGSCGGNNGNNATSVEPGSGVTIMAYAGICGATNDLAPNSIAYFHSISYDEIVNFSNLLGGNSCPVITASGNSAPVVIGSAGYVIPSNTPFVLTGSATDPDNDALTYQWEQADAGASPSNWNSGSKPFFRSYVPTTNPSRSFPSLAVILTGSMQATKGEFLPTTAQTLKFRFTARDNKMGGGGVCYAANQITVSATPAFSVTSQNSTGIVYQSGSVQNVTWDVNGTNAAPFNSPNVNIYLSTNSGTTFTLAVGNTPNDGAENITLPVVAANVTTCRVKVESIGNVFFDINNRNFTVSLTAGVAQISANSIGLQVYPNPFTSNVKIDIANAKGLNADKTVLNVYDILGNLVRTENLKLTDNYSQIYDLSALANGSYIVEVTDGKQKTTAKLIKL